MDMMEFGLTKFKELTYRLFNKNIAESVLWAKYPYLSLVLSVGIAYTSYYVLYIAKKPKIVGNAKFVDFLFRHCPVLHRKFSPTIWCVGTRAQTIFQNLLKRKPNITLQREILSLPDGGQVGLDWLNVQDTAAPTVIILPGITGSSGESYALNLVNQAWLQGYRSLIFNYRGNGGVDLLTPRTYNAANTDDLECVITHIHKLYPDSQVLAAGVSMGGIILVNHIFKNGKSCGLTGAMALSVPYDMAISSKSLEEPVQRYTFNKLLTANLISSGRKYAHMFSTKNLNLDKVLQSGTIREFDENFTSKVFGYQDCDEYYQDADLVRKVGNLCIPFMALSAADDVFSPGFAIPEKEVSESANNAAIVITSHGGHIGFMEGFWPRGPNYMDFVFAQYIRALIDHGHEIAQ